MSGKTKYQRNAASAKKYRAENGIKTLGITCREETRERWKSAVKQSGLSAEDLLNNLLNSAGY